jgi:hypothetical protein
MFPPPTKKSNRNHHTLLQHSEVEVEDDDEDNNIEVMPPLVAVAETRGFNCNFITRGGNTPPSDYSCHIKMSLLDPNHHNCGNCFDIVDRRGELTSYRSTIWCHLAWFGHRV